MPLEFRQNPDAQAAFNRMTNGGTTLPSEFDLNVEINGEHSLTETVATPPCATCGVEEGEEFTARLGDYSNMTEERRRALVRLIMEEGPDRHASTTLDLPGGRFEVMNDAFTLPDGTYVNFTFGEAGEMARRWGCRLPNYDQAEAIRRYAERQGERLPSSQPRMGQRYS
jgi:hypothetical protein